MRMRALAAAIAVGAAVLVVPSSAFGDGVPPINIGPISVHHGYQLTIQAGCGKYSFVSLQFLKTAKGMTQDHVVNLTAKPKTCKLAANLSSAQLDANLGKAGSIQVTIRHRGKASREKPFLGCTGKGPLVQPANAMGSIKVSFESGFFGSVRAGSSSSWLESVPNEHCGPPPGYSKEINFSASFGSMGTAFVSATQPVHGLRSVFINAEGTVDGFHVNHSLSFTGGRSVFSAPASLDTAEVGSVSPWSSGSLTFHAKSGCSGRPSRSGTLTGTLTIHLDTVGKLVLKGAQAVQPVLSRGFGGPPC